MGRSDPVEIEYAKKFIPIILNGIDRLDNIQNIMLYFLYVGELIAKVLGKIVNGKLITGTDTAGDMCDKYGYSANFKDIVLELITIRNKLMHCEMIKCYEYLESLRKYDRTYLTETDKTFEYLPYINRITDDCIKQLLSYMENNFNINADDTVDTNNDVVLDMPELIF